MKKLLFLSPLALGLSSCLLVGDLALTITEFSTNFLVGNESVICDNRTTTVTYRFNASGDLASWQSVLIGRATGAEFGRQNFIPTDDQDPDNRRVRVSYEVPPFTAPLRVQPQSIVVTPAPQQVLFSDNGGRVKLRITARTSDGLSGTLDYGNLRVGNCTFPPLP